MRRGEHGLTRRRLQCRCALRDGLQFDVGFTMAAEKPQKTGLTTDSMWFRLRIDRDHMEGAPRRRLVETSSPPDAPSVYILATFLKIW
ncbi:MAG: hypothetical protein LBG43_04310 [Treponema sp.]|jgi:hypothetical protein|nr:hypothetical protein [Treponema sp.]